jgi:hypothetical protein
MDTATFERAVEAFSSANAQDPKTILLDGKPQPFELVQAARRARWVRQLVVEPSWALKLAAHCQHLRRWEIPRESYDDGRLGYLKWRKALSQFHADAAAETLRQLGIDDDTIQQVRRINLKQGLHQNADTQHMEDVLCLVFLQYEFEAFAGKHDDKKVVSILKKSWAKMSDRGRRAALALDLPPRLSALVKRALSNP